jgi:chemotaxis response regulator CheB
MKLTTECSGRMDYRIECRQPAGTQGVFQRPAVVAHHDFVAQHISENAYEQMLTRLKDQAKTWAVQSATDGAKVNPNTVFLVPRDKTVEIRGGVIELKQFVTPELSFNPSIDGVIRSISACHQVGSG